jgi:hypothetical protein
MKCTHHPTPPWRALEWKMLFYFMAFFNILQPLGTLWGHLVYFEAICYILLPFGIHISWPLGLDLMAILISYIQMVFYGHLVYFMAICYFYGHLLYFMDIGYILWPFGIFYGHVVNIMAILNSINLVCLWTFGKCFPRFGMLYQDKSGNPNHWRRNLRKTWSRSALVGTTPPTRYWSNSWTKTETKPT